MTAPNHSLDDLRQTLLTHTPTAGPLPAASDIVTRAALERRRRQSLTGAAGAVVLAAVAVAATRADRLWQDTPADPASPTPASAGALRAPLAQPGPDQATARRMLQPCLDDNDNGIASGGLGLPSGSTWNVLAARTVLPQDPGAAIHLERGVRTIDTQTLVIAKQPATRRLAICVVPKTRIDQYGMGNSEILTIPEVQAPTGQLMQFTPVQTADLIFVVGRYGAGVRHVRVSSAAGSELAYLHNGVFIGVLPYHQDRATSFPPQDRQWSFTATPVP